jgi:hypothetical protein
MTICEQDMHLYTVDTLVKAAKKFKTILRKDAGYET